MPFWLSSTSEQLVERQLGKPAAQTLHFAFTLGRIKMFPHYTEK